MNSRYLLLAVAAGIALAACDDGETLRPSGQRPPSSADPLHMFSTALSTDPRQQALDALASDAFRRESRFLDAADPGRLFRATRASEADVEAGAFAPGDLFQLGGQLFNVSFTRDVGFGARDLPPLTRIQTGQRGGPDALRCADCHYRGGPAGGGDGADAAYLDGDGNSQASALGRNPIALMGEGLVEILAREMSAELAAGKATLVAAAAKKGAKVTGPLVAKGISFGSITARPDGSIDAHALTGVDADLVVKPFGWKGSASTIRDVVEDELLLHHGMESDYLVAHAPKERVGPFGGADPDGDGVTSEIVEGQVSVLTLYVAMQEVPITAAPTDSGQVIMLADGRAAFDSLGCSACHVASLPLGTTTFTLPSRAGGATVSVDLATAGAMPRLAPSAEDGTMRASLFSDLKRHDLGPALAEPRSYRGVAGSAFLTRPLWGVARSGPYLHDGRAPTLEEAILAHGGEAQGARDAYAALDDPHRGEVRLFLASLTRAKRMVAQ